MPEMIDLRNVVEDVVSSYEARIENIGSLFDSAYSILGDFQGAVADVKEEREKIGNQVRDTLARNEHLRRKDFDNMMRDILLTQEQREKEVRNSLREYGNAHKAMAQALKENLGKFKNSLAKGEAERVGEFQALMKDILAEQEKRKQDVASKLTEFQKQQHDLAARLRGLLVRGNDLRIRDFKSMLEEFAAQREKRLALQKESKEEVAEMRAPFRRERQEAFA